MHLKTCKAGLMVGCENPEERNSKQHVHFIKRPGQACRRLRSFWWHKARVTVDQKCCCAISLLSNAVNEMRHCHHCLCPVMESEANRHSRTVQLQAGFAKYIANFTLGSGHAYVSVVNYESCFLAILGFKDNEWLHATQNYTVDDLIWNCMLAEPLSLDPRYTV